MKGFRKAGAHRFAAIATLLVVAGVTAVSALTMSRDELYSRIRGGWIAKHAGVTAGAPTEFKAMGMNMWTGDINLYPNLASGAWQDDIYVQITFLDVMKKKLNGPKGIFEATMGDYGEAFKNTTYGLWCANKAARDNLQAGILPPHSGMWAGQAHRYNPKSDAIDFQIESDWIGFMCPAMPMTAVEIADSVGHVMNYADGLYGGYFVTTMIALAFTYDDVYTIVTEAMKVLPTGSRYHQILTDVVTFHDSNPDKDYADCWYAIASKWLDIGKNVCCVFNSSTQPGNTFNITAHYNGAFIAIGLLYGNGDPVKTIEYAIRCGQDSDCNPANAGAVLGAMLGEDNLPQQWRTSYQNAINDGKTYSHTSYSFEMLLNASVSCAEKAIVQKGGSIEGGTCVIVEETPSQPRMWERYGFDPIANPDYQQTATAITAAAPRAYGGAKTTVSLTRTGMAVLVVRPGSKTVRTYDISGKVIANQGNIRRGWTD